MITKEKIGIYKKYHGDIDGWARMGSPSEQELMQDEDWYVIDDLLQDLALMKDGKTSEDYNQKLMQKLMDNCAGEDIVKELGELSDQRF